MTRRDNGTGGDSVGASGESVLGRGLWVLGRAVRHEPRVFVLSVLGSIGFGLLTIASAFVVGAVVGHVVVPAFENDRVDAGGLAVGAAAILARQPAQGVRHLRPPARRRGMQFRLQATLPAPGDPPLPGPAAGLAPAQRHRHAAVQRQLRRRGGLVPDRAAAVRGRHRGHAGRRGRRRCSSSTGHSRWSAWRVFPALFALNVDLLAPDVAPGGPGPAAARRGQRDRARELRRRAGGQDDGPGGAGDRALRRPGRRAARRA